MPHARQGGAGISRSELAGLCLACTRCGWDCAASAGGNIAAAGGGGVGVGVGAGLSVHVGVGCGRVSCFHVGSDRLGWQLVVSGRLFEDQVRGLRALLALHYFRFFLDFFKDSGPNSSSSILNPGAVSPVEYFARSASRIA